MHSKSGRNTRRATPQNKSQPSERFSILLLLFLAVGLTACADDASEPAESGGAGAVSELVIEEIADGEGEPAVDGKPVFVHYTGWLYDPDKADHRGKKFDSSLDRGKPFSFKLGAGRVIKGWDQGVVGMKVGAKRVLTIPPSLGYGARGAGSSIPPDATLIFEIERVAP